MDSAVTMVNAYPYNIQDRMLFIISSTDILITHQIWNEHINQLMIRFQTHLNWHSCINYQLNIDDIITGTNILITHVY